MHSQHIIAIFLLDDCNLFNFVINFSHYLIFGCFLLLFDLHWFDWSCMWCWINWVNGLDCFADSWILLDQILNIIGISNCFSIFVCRLLVWQHIYVVWDFNSLNKFNGFGWFIINENILLFCIINYRSNSYIFLYICTKCLNSQSFNLSCDSGQRLNLCYNLLNLWHLFNCYSDGWSWNSLNINNWSLNSSQTRCNCRCWFLRYIFWINNLDDSCFGIEERCNLNRCPIFGKHNCCLLYIAISHNLCWNWLISYQLCFLFNNILCHCFDRNIFLDHFCICSHNNCIPSYWWNTNLCTFNRFSFILNIICLHINNLQFLPSLLNQSHIS